MKTSGNLLRAVLALAAFGVAAVFTSAADEPPALREVPLVVGLARSSFTGLNENDAVAAYRSFVTAMGRKRGYEIHSVIRIFDTNEDFAQALHGGELQFIVVSTWQYLEMNMRTYADPSFVPVISGSSQHRLLLLARRAAGIRTVADLAGKPVLVVWNGNNHLAEPWLDSLCLDAGLGLATHAFGSVRSVVKPSAAVLPVFFGRVPACVVDDSAFSVLSELNPQIERELAVIATSAPMLDAVACISRSGWRSIEERESFRHSLLEAHDDTAGRQILTLFKVDGLHPFEPAQLDSVAALHLRLQRARDAALAGSPTPLSSSSP
ncbi:MAG TPA: PhnD/SsuA/transferrin family substrate-binding protein [Opitutus sp.]|nr:PhnD/SsuA/transferrin family substrate-binding protein [Opitutus sp.]